MRIPYICSACRRNILATVRRRGAGQPRSYGTFVSLAPRQSSTHDMVSEDSLAIGASRTVETSYTKSQYAGPALRRAKDPQRRSDDALDTLFEESRRASSKSPSRDPKRQAAILALHEHTETLKDLLSDTDKPTGGIWQYFVAHLSASAWLINIPGETAIPRPVAFKAVTDQLFRRLQTEKAQSPAADHIATVADITGVYTDLELLSPSSWIALLYDLLRKLAEQTERPQDRSNIEISRVISDDIVGAWSVFCKFYSPRTNRTDHNHGDSRYDWDFPLPTSYSSLPSAELRGGLAEVFLSLWPHCPRPHWDSLTFAALSTFSLIAKASLQDPIYIQQRNAFTSAVARLLVGAKCDVNDILRYQIGDPIGVLNLDWSLAIRNAETISGRSIIRQDDRSAYSGQKTVPILENHLTSFLQKISRATTERNLSSIDYMWDQVQASPPPAVVLIRPTVNGNRVGGKYQHEKIFHDLCNQFILSYMTLGKSDRAINVWNHMVNTSRHPTLSTWNSMLEGCRRSRNVSSLETVWVRLRSSALQPDVFCWRTRVNGLVECGKPEMAVRAFAEMGREWREAAETQREQMDAARVADGPVKPTIETLNDAISGLLRHGHQSSAKHILALGDEFGIKANIYTFNILMRDLVRDGRVRSVPALLTEMQKQGVQADVATFTTIIEGILNVSVPSSPQEQLKLIEFVFTEMKAAGVEPDQVTYSTILHCLSQQEQNPMKVVQAVLAHMAKQKVEPSRETYTILVRMHFSQDPPDLESVRSILDRIRVSGQAMDHIFWDRVIEGYASAGDTANALVVLRRIDNEGRKAGLRALDMLLHALAKDGELDIARQIVQKVKAGRRGPPRPREKGVFWQHSFWTSVRNLGLMDDT